MTSREATRAEGPGVLVAIVGPSGVGKDSIIRGLKAQLPADHFFFPRRIITRPADGHEDNLFVEPGQFGEALARGAYALSWEANGLAYALPGEVDYAISDGRHVIANLSRAAVTMARERFPRVLVVHITARPEVIEARLQARGRETGSLVQERMQRGFALDKGIQADIRIENNGSVSDSVSALAGLLGALVQRKGPSL